MSETIETRFARMQEIVQSDQFLSRKGIINEVPFFIFAYPPAEEVPVQKHTGYMVKRLRTMGVSVLEINLYDLCVDIIKDQGYWDKLLEMEVQWKKDKFERQLKNLVEIREHLMPAIVKRIEDAGEPGVLFLTGVGNVYPLVRTHTVLNNLQSIAKDYPTLLFFPGEYTFTEGRGQSLDLFGVLKEDRYYRAFNIMEYKLQS